MKLLEIKNNLVKLAYTESEVPVLGRFIILAAENKSYVAQFVNLKSDTVNSYAIAKLLFTFSSDGVVDNYDGSAPDINSEVSFLPSGELLNLLPLETPVKMGVLSQQEDMLNLDISVFERNFTVFAEKDSNKAVFISNCVRQLFRMKEKCVIADNANLFEDYPKLMLSRDFKLPLNAQTMDYIFEYELSEVDVSTRAVIQDIFYEVQQYIKTLEGEFLPIEKFVDVVASQYKATQMPELALLKNKLLRYRDAGVFADTLDEITALREKLDRKNCVIIDIKDINESLQKEVLSIVHQTLESFDKYIYFFVPLTDGNSDKKLLNRFVNHNHVFTTVLASSSYKYASELKEHAQNMLLFAPSTVNHDFSIYNTFISKLNNDECIVEGKLTQGVPFVIDMEDLDLDLTKDDVLGERCQFVPVAQDVRIVRTDEFGAQEYVDEIPEESSVNEASFDNQPEENSFEDTQAQEPVIESEQIIPDTEEIIEEPESQKMEIIEPVANVMEEESFEPETLTETEFDNYVQESEESEPEPEIQSVEELIPEEDETVLSEDDLDFIEENQLPELEDIEDYIEESPYDEEQTPVVPVYPAEDEDAGLESAGEFNQGDSVTHPRYGRGVIEKIINYGNKTLCSISFENVGRRLLDPTISELTKL